MREKFVDSLKLSKANIEMLHMINEILEEYKSDGYTLTLRQLYYQLVSRNFMPNKQNEYAKLSRLLTKGRMAGVVDWDSIEDRLRQPDLPYYVDGISDAIYQASRHYRLDRMSGQEKYIEVRVEKDALSGILRRVTRKYHINLMVNRGYSSCSAMYDAYNRFEGKDEPHVLYLGDHDPSGLDMIRDVQERLLEFGVDLTIHHLAITKEQIDEYAPPPNPAKITDPRAGRYLDNYGNKSREVDALPPQILIDVVEGKILGMINVERYESMVRIEAEDRERMQEIAQNIDE